MYTSTATVLTHKTRPPYRMRELEYRTSGCGTGYAFKVQDHAPSRGWDFVVRTSDGRAPSLFFAPNPSPEAVAPTRHSALEGKKPPKTAIHSGIGTSTRIHYAPAAKVHVLSMALCTRVPCRELPIGRPGTAVFEFGTRVLKYYYSTPRTTGSV